MLKFILYLASQSLFKMVPVHFWCIHIMFWVVLNFLGVRCPRLWNWAKGLCVCSAESQTLTAGVCSKVRICYRVPCKGVGDKPQVRSNLAFELGIFLKGKSKEAGINHGLVTFLSHSFGSQDVSGLWFSQSGGPWLGDLLAHLALEKWPEFVYYWWYLQQQF